MPENQTKRLFRALPALSAIAVFGVALLALHRLTTDLSLGDVLAAAAAVSGSSLIAASALTVASYLALAGYDVLALRYVSSRIAHRQAAMTSFIAFAIGQNVGMVALSAGAIRYRMYSLAGLSAAEIAQVIAFCTITFPLGAGLLLGISLVSEAGHAASALHTSRIPAIILGAAVLAAVTAYVALSALRRTPLNLGAWRIPLPGLGMTLAQISVACLDLAFAGAALFALLPAEPGISFTAFLGLYMVAMVAGAASTVPGGIGVFESVLLLLLPGVGVRPLLGALLIYRIIYYVAPFTAAIFLLTANELRSRRALVRQAWKWTRRSLEFVVPQAMSVLTFAAGAILLVSGATPAVTNRLDALERILPLPVVEISHLAGSAIGVALLILARGLYYRLDAAWFLMSWLLGAGITASLMKGLDYEEATLLTLVLLALLATRRQFYRRASLLAEPLAPRWQAAVAMTVGASIWIGLLAHREVPYRHELWWQFAFDASAPRMMRASLVAILGLGTVAIYRLLQPPRHSAPRPDETDLVRAGNVLRTCTDTTGHLALLGDKVLLFSETGRSFLMYAVSGRSWVAMGDPVGPAEERAELIWRFREICDREGGWCVFYEVAADSLPLYVDAGLSLSKLGEQARVDLRGFTLEGKSRAALRHSVHRVEREAVSFSVVPAEEVGPLMPRLRAISDAWLAEKSSGEKGFSLGFFKEDYLRQCPCAIVRRDGCAVAFANLWTGTCRHEASIDLMRYVADAPKGVMDYLFVQTMFWAKAQGYEWFSLGMAPLAGLEDHRLAPAWHKLGRLVYRYGENFYNFEGLRHYKAKFQPEWRPRYLAAPSGMVLPRVLLDVTALISGSLGRTIAPGPAQRS